MKVIITGIGGHLGGRFAHWIVKNKPGTEIIGIDNFSCGYEDNAPREAEIKRITLGKDPVDLKWFDGADYIFHFAAYAAEGLSPFIRHFDTTNNLLSTIDILNACLNVRTVNRIVFTSSMSVYGKNTPPFDESYQRKPIDAYGISKSACEQHLETAFAQHAQSYCIIRPHNLYGPYQSGWQVFRNVLAYWMCRTLQEQPMLIYGDGEQTRAFSYINDVLPCFWEGAERPEAGQEIINLGGANPVSIKDAATACARITGGAVKFVEGRHEVKYAYCTTQKSEQLLGYNETTGFEDGLMAMWEWTKWAWEKYPDRRGTHKITDIEVEKGLYSYWRDYI